MPNAQGQAARSDIAQRMSDKLVLLGEEANPDLPRDPWEPRWRIEQRWIEFECGCRCERVPQVFRPAVFDPIIFAGTDQMAVYDFVCHRHEPGMNKYVSFGGFVDFAQWKAARRATLTGRVRA
jgi:hypothetical protein